MQRIADAAPNEECAALDAEDLGYLQKVNTHTHITPADPQHIHSPPNAVEPGSYCALLKKDWERVSCSSLLVMNMSSLVALSPRPLSCAVDFDSGLKARCAMAKSDSPGITSRPVEHSRHVRVAGHPVDAVDEHMRAEEVCELPLPLTVYVAAQASAETQYNINKTSR